MNNNIFIPKKINIGFQERNGTYTGKLAYIIYFDEKGKLRKEKSWSSWRDEKIDNVIFDNIPTEGFVLNKKAGGHSTGWDYRQSYVRVYDPRDFEFEITIENLLYILENTSSIKGKGLEGRFIYGWSGKDLILIPCESPDYKEMQQYNEIVFENKSIKAKDLVIGATYKTKDNTDLIYLGKFDEYGYNGENKGKKFWFYNRELGYCKFTTMKTIPKNKFIHIINENCCDDYADLFDELECYYYYSPVDNSKDKYMDYDLECFKEMINEKILNQSYWWSKLKVYSNIDNLQTKIEIERVSRETGNLLKVTKKSKKTEKYSSWYYGVNEREIEYDETIMESENLEEIFNKLQPQYKNIYLQNGKLKGGKENNE